jgi:hypothetical protein
MKDQPTKDEFAKLMTDRIRAAGEKDNIAYEAEEFRLHGEGERAGVIFLINAYKEYCAAPTDARERVIKNWVRNWFAVSKKMPEDFEDVKPDLMPAVRSRAHFDLNSLRGEVESGKTTSWQYRVVGERSTRSCTKIRFSTRRPMAFVDALEDLVGELLGIPESLYESVNRHHDAQPQILAKRLGRFSSLLGLRIANAQRRRLLCPLLLFSHPSPNEHLFSFLDKDRLTLRPNSCTGG